MSNQMWHKGINVVVALVLAVMLFPILQPATPVAAADITFDASSSSQGAGASSIQWQHTVGNYSDRILIVASAVEEDTTDAWIITGVTWNTTESFTKAKSEVVGTSYRASSEIWYLLAPSVGTYNIEVTYTGDIRYMSVGAASFYNVKQQAPEATGSNTAESSPTISTNITTQTDGAIVIDCVASGDAVSFTATSPQAEFFDEETGSSGGAGSYKTLASAGATSMGQTADASANRMSQVAVAFAPLAEPALDQNHYRWRDDQYGLNENNGWHTVEDTAYGSLVKQTTVRLRAEIANTGSSSADNYQYLLEYATSTDGPWTAVPVTATTEPFEMVLSGQYADGDNTTSGFLTATGNWANGKGVEDPSNQTGNHSLTNAYYTEFEYAIEATDDATAGGTYYFRLTDDGSPLDNYAVYPEVAIYTPPNVDQVHYRWRSDDGVEGGAEFSATTADGYVQASNATYSTAHDAASGTVDNTGNTIRLGQQLTGGTYYVDRPALYFDTSAIPDAATITSAKLALYVSEDNSTQDFNIQLQRGNLTLTKEAETTVTDVRQIHGQDYDGSQYIYWSARDQGAESLTKMDKDTISSYTTYDPTGGDENTFRDDYVIYCSANSKVYVVAQDDGDLDHMKLYEFDPSTSAYVEKIDFNTAFIPGGLVYAFGYLWTGNRDGKVYRVNISTFAYDTYDYGTDSDDLHWLGANSTHVWGTSVAGDGDLIKIDPSDPVNNHWHWQLGTAYTPTDDSYVNDSYVYINLEESSTGFRIMNISTEAFTTWSGTYTGPAYGAWRWQPNFDGQEDFLAICYSTGYLEWVDFDAATITARNDYNCNSLDGLTTPNEIQPIGDYLYTTDWSATPVSVFKYKLDKIQYPSATLTGTDYDETKYLRNGGSLSTSGISTGYIDIDLNSTSYKWIDKTGTSKFILRSSRDISETTPSGDEYIKFSSANQGGAYVPVLTVTYETTATWKAATDTPATGQARFENLRVRFTIQNTGGVASNYNYRLQVSDNQTSGYADVPLFSTPGCSVVCMATSTHFTDQDATTRQLSIPGSLLWTAGKMVEDTSNQTDAITLNKNYFTEAEFNFQFTSVAQGSTTYYFRVVNSTTELDSYSQVAEITMGAVPTWDSYNDAGHTSQTEDFTTYETDHWVYMYGEGFTPSAIYKVVYWDPLGTKRVVDSSVEAGSSGNLSSQHEFELGDEVGNWHCTVYYPASYNATAYSTTDSNIETDDTSYPTGCCAFNMQEGAIPEFPTIISAIVAVGLCFGIYYWMRRRRVYRVN